MSNFNFVKTYSEPVIDKNEVLRYAGIKDVENANLPLYDEVLKELDGKLSYKVCCVEAQVKITGKICDFGFFKAESEKLSQNLDGCKKVILFAATLGVEIDRLIAKYGALSPAKALILDAFGNERIEALCNTFCNELKENNLTLKPRFSPGYGDLAIEVQKEIFSVLGCQKKIGLTLNDSMLMSPSKSVTAFVGII